MKKRSLIFSLFVVAALVLTACSAAPSTVYPEMDRGAYSNDGAVEAPMAESQEEAYALDESGKSYTDSAIDTGATVDRLVIRNANLVIVVLQPDKALLDIQQMAETLTGYVVDSNLYKRSLYDGSQVFEAAITVRVPAEKLDIALTQIKGLVEDPKTDIVSENVTGQDVTKEYTDLESRLRNLESASEQLEKIMDSATKPADVLEIFNQLKSVNEEIELVKGQMQYYTESAAMSAINVTLQAKETIEPVTIAGWSPEGIARDALQSLINVYQWIATVVIQFGIICLPVLLPVGVVVFFIVKAIRRTRRNKKAEAKAALPQEPQPPQA